MDFLKKAQKKMKDLMDDDDGKKDQMGTSNGPSYGYGDGQSNYQQPQHVYRDAPPPPQGQYGQASLPPQSQYGQAPLPPQNQYGQAPLPPLPPGWLAQWDQNSQRHYFVEQATGRTQWDPPMAPYGVPSGHGYHQQEGKGRGVSTLAAGAGGLAVGAIGGAILAHELTENSDDEHRSAATYGAPAGDPYQASMPPPVGDPYQASMPPPVPDETADGSSMSSSDREEIEDKREELQEAQEEYNEAVEEGYDD